MGRLGPVIDVFPVRPRSGYKSQGGPRISTNGLRRWVDSLATAQEGASGVKGYFPSGETLARMWCELWSIFERPCAVLLASHRRKCGLA